MLFFKSNTTPVKAPVGTRWMVTEDSTIPYVYPYDRKRVWLALVDERGATLETPIRSSTGSWDPIAKDVDGYTVVRHQCWSVEPHRIRARSLMMVIEYKNKIREEKIIKEITAKINSNII